MDDRPPSGAPEIVKRITQPEDEVPDVYMKDGRLTSKNPTEPKKRAEFEIDEIRSTFDFRPLMQAANEFHKRNDLNGFIKCWKDSVMDIKVNGRAVLITLRPSGSGDK